MKYSSRTIWNYLKLWVSEDLRWNKLINYSRLAETASIGGILYIFFSSSDNSSEVLLGVFFIGLISLFFVLDNILLKGKIYYQFQIMEPLEKKAKMADSIRLINIAFAEVHKLARAEFNPEIALSAYTKLCDQLALTFNDYTGSTCSVCIKIFNTPTSAQKVSVVTLCRDSMNPKRNLPIDKSFSHEVKKNTDFVEILENFGKAGGLKFFDNNLPLRKGYMNTSFPNYSNHCTYKGLDSDLDDDQRVKQWPLPYQSCLVVPINETSSPISQEKFIGYLCLDCEDINSLDDNIAYDLLSGISDGIYNSISTFVKTLNHG